MCVHGDASQRLQQLIQQSAFAMFPWALGSCDVTFCSISKSQMSFLTSRHRCTMHHVEPLYKDEWMCKGSWEVESSNYMCTNQQGLSVVSRWSPPHQFRPARQGSNPGALPLRTNQPHQPHLQPQALPLPLPRTDQQCEYWSYVAFLLLHIFFFVHVEVSKLVV